MRPRKALGLALLALLAMPALAQKRYSVEELMNPLLSPELALWLVGPVVQMATKDEIAAFGKATTDEEGRAVIEAFWQARDPDPAYEGNALRERFDKRLAEADRLFGEAGLPGRRTDRGTIYVLYGAPSKEEFVIAEHRDDPPILQWSYAADVGAGLDGKKPQRFYRFIRRGDLTVFYTPNLRPPKPRVGRPF